MTPAQEQAAPRLPDGREPGLGVLPLFLVLGLWHLAVVWHLGGWLAMERAGVGTALVVFASIMVASGASLHARYPHRRLGLCNAVTQLRAALAAALVVPAVSPGVLMRDEGLAWAVLALALLALVLDGVDGWLARRSGLVSDFGARFDVEVDAFLALVLSVLVVQGGKVGGWVLALGLMRYAFVGAARVWPWLSDPLPERQSRKVVCVVQIGTLIALLAPVIGPGLAQPLALVAVALLVWSFGRDVLWLARR